jgi:hypothetical protein
MFPALCNLSGQRWVNLRGNLRAKFFNVSATVQTVYLTILIISEG